MDLTVAQLILQDHKITYAIADRDLNVVEVGGAVGVFNDLTTWLGHPLLDLVPELIGSEAVLADILAMELPRFQLERINRSAPDGGTRYLTLTVLPYWGDDAEAALLTVLADVSEQGRFAQMLAQRRNELRLLRHDLAEANTQLDFLLRHYVPTEVADALLERRIPLQPGGELRLVSVLFADLRGYSRVAEQLSPTQTMELLNEYLNVACDAIAEAGGTIAQFMGDSVMALFNAPNDQPDHARLAVQAGLTIQRKTAVHQSQVAAGLPILHFGVGIHSGPAVVGNTGARWRYDYSAIGDTTNVAYRITTVAQAQEVLIGPTTCEQLRGCVTVTPLTPMSFKGKSQPIPIYRVLSLAPETTNVKS